MNERDIAGNWYQNEAERGLDLILAFLYQLKALNPADSNSQLEQPRSMRFIQGYTMEGAEEPPKLSVQQSLPGQHSTGCISATAQLSATTAQGHT